MPLPSQPPWGYTAHTPAAGCCVGGEYRWKSGSERAAVTPVCVYVGGRGEGVCVCACACVCVRVCVRVGGCGWVHVSVFVCVVCGVCGGVWV